MKNQDPLDRRKDAMVDAAIDRANEKPQVFPSDSPVKFYDGKAGQYQCFCCQCGNPFYGDKRDVLCPACELPQDARPPQPIPTPEPQPERMPEVRLVCSKHRCDWTGDSNTCLRAADPFNDGSDLLACPFCREQTLVTCCDEPGCYEPDTCGTPTPNGYRRTCGKHLPKVEGEV